MSRVSLTPVDGEHAGHGSVDDPYDRTELVTRLTAGAVEARRAVVTVDAGTIEVLTLWQPVGDRFVVRTSDYAALHLTGSLGSAALIKARHLLDDALAAEGATSEVSLLGPFSTHRDRPGERARTLDAAGHRALAAAWQAAPRKALAVVEWDEDTPTLASVDAKVRNDIRVGLGHDTGWQRFGPDDAGSFAGDYAALMHDKDAAGRWRLDEGFFAELAAGRAGELWLASVHGEAGAAQALFARAGRRAAYLFATRRGALRGAPAAALWRAFEGLHALGVREVLLGGGVGDGPDDSLWRFKQRFATATATLHLGARLFDEAGHRHAVGLGLARPLPEPFQRVAPGRCAA